jgi:hypothetical protein
VGLTSVLLLLYSAFSFCISAVLLERQYGAAGRMLEARPHGRFDLYLTLVKCVIPLVFALFGDPVISSAALVVAGLGWLYLVLMRQPYYTGFTNHLFNAAGASFLWVSVCAAVNQSSSDTVFGFAMSIVAVVGLVAAAVSGVTLGHCRHRIMAAAVESGGSHVFKSPYHVELATRVLLDQGRALGAAGKKVPFDNAEVRRNLGRLRIRPSAKIHPLTGAAETTTQAGDANATVGGATGRSGSLDYGDLTHRPFAATSASAVASTNPRTTTVIVAGMDPAGPSDLASLNRDAQEFTRRTRALEEESAMRLIAIRRAAELYQQASLESFPDSALLDLFHANFIHCFPEAVSLVEYAGFRGYKRTMDGYPTGEAVTAADFELFLLEGGLHKQPGVDVQFLLMQARQALRLEISQVLQEAKLESGGAAGNAAESSAMASLATATKTGGGSDRGIVENVSFERLMRECTTASLAVQACEVKLWSELLGRQPSSFRLYLRIMDMTQLQAKAEKRYADWLRMSPGDPNVLQSYAMYLLHVRRDVQAAERQYKDIDAILKGRLAGGAVAALNASQVAVASPTRAQAASSSRRGSVTERRNSIQRAAQVGGAMNIADAGGIIGAMMRRADKLSLELRSILDSGKSIDSRADSKTSSKRFDFGDIVQATVLKQKVEKARTAADRVRRMVDVRRVVDVLSLAPERSVVTLRRTVLAMLAVLAVIFWAGVGAVNQFSFAFEETVEDYLRSSDLNQMNENMVRSLYRSALLASSVIPSTDADSYYGHLGSLRYQGANFSVLHRSLYRSGGGNSRIAAEAALYNSPVMQASSLSVDGIVSNLPRSLSDAVTDVASRALSLSRSPPAMQNFSLFSSDAFYITYNGPRGIRDALALSLVLSADRGRLEVDLIEQISLYAVAACCATLILPFLFIIIPILVHIQSAEERLYNVFSTVTPLAIRQARNTIIDRITALRGELKTDSEYFSLLAEVGLDPLQLSKDPDNHTHSFKDSGLREIALPLGEGEFSEAEPLGKKTDVVKDHDSVSLDRGTDRSRGSAHEPLGPRGLRLGQSAVLFFHLVGRALLPIFVLLLFVGGAFAHAQLALWKADGMRGLVNHIARLRSELFVPAAASRTYFADAATERASLQSPNSRFVSKSNGCDKDDLAAYVEPFLARREQSVRLLEIILDGSTDGGKPIAQNDLMSVTELGDSTLLDLFLGNACQLAAQAGVIHAGGSHGITSNALAAGQSPVFCASSNPVNTGSFKGLAGLGLASAVITHAERAESLFLTRMAQNRTASLQGQQCSPLNFTEPSSLWSLDSSLVNFLDPVARLAVARSLELFSDHMQNFRSGQIVFSVFLAIASFLLYFFLLRKHLQYLDAHTKRARDFVFFLPPGCLEPETLSQALAGSAYIPPGTM